MPAEGTISAKIEVVDATVRKGAGDGEGGTAILRSVSVEFAAGVITAVVGPSGSGKSTLLRLLNGLEPATSGSIYLDGEDIEGIEVTRLRRRVGMIFQTPTMFDGTVEDNINSSKRWANEEGAAEPVGEYLGLVGLPEGISDREASTLSVGEQQRVSMARCLVTSPEVLLLDEPTAHLDPAATNQILRLIRELTEKLGLAAVLVTHDIESARMTAERAVVLIGGRIVEEGSREEVFDSPRAEMTRRFMAGELEEVS